MLKIRHLLVARTVRTRATLLATAVAVSALPLAVGVPNAGASASCPSEVATSALLTCISSPNGDYQLAMINFDSATATYSNLAEYAVGEHGIANGVIWGTGKAGTDFGFAGGELQEVDFGASKVTYRSKTFAGSTGVQVGNDGDIQFVDAGGSVLGEFDLRPTAAGMIALASQQIGDWACSVDSLGQTYPNGNDNGGFAAPGLGTGDGNSCNVSEWCSDFAWWAMTDTVLDSNAYQMPPAADGVADEAASVQEYGGKWTLATADGSVEPAAGDLVIFTSSNSSTSLGDIAHVAIVAKVDTKTGTMQTIGGNEETMITSVGRDGPGVKLDPSYSYKLFTQIPGSGTTGEPDKVYVLGFVQPTL